MVYSETTLTDSSFSFLYSPWCCLYGSQKATIFDWFISLAVPRWSEARRINTLTWSWSWICQQWGHATDWDTNQSKFSVCQQGELMGSPWISHVRWGEKHIFSASGRPDSLLFFLEASNPGGLLASRHAAPPSPTSADVPYPRSHFLRSWRTPSSALVSLALWRLIERLRLLWLAEGGWAPETLAWPPSSPASLSASPRCWAGSCDREERLLSPLPLLTQRKFCNRGGRRSSVTSPVKNNWHI